MHLNSEHTDIHTMTTTLQSFLLIMVSALIAEHGMYIVQRGRPIQTSSELLAVCISDVQIICAVLFVIVAFILSIFHHS